MAAVKRAGQPLELRLVIERVFDVEFDALIAVCGDFNTEDHDTALRLACAGEDDTGSGHLAGRALTPVERTLPVGQTLHRIASRARKCSTTSWQALPCLRIFRVSS